MELYDLKALSKKLGLTVRTLREYIKQGHLRASKIGRNYYVTEENLVAFVEAKECFSDWI